MKAVILAGGFGTRFAEETDVRPKPMVEIGGYPIIWHIMKHYSFHGINEFILCLGYKAEFIKRYFLDYAICQSDFTIDVNTQELSVFKRGSENWKVTLIDTGLNTMTGGRVRRVIQQLGIEDTFCLTYGDGLSNVDITGSINFHKTHRKLATVTAVTPPGRFGVLDIDSEGSVTGFREKIASDQYRINGGFFVLEPEVINFIASDEIIWEDVPMRNLAKQGEIKAWNHDDFWQPMDTLRDKKHLENLWNSGNPPWVMGR
mgnify:CR=1 FL=1